MNDLDNLFGTYSDYYFFFFVPTSTFMNGYLADFHMFRREFYNVWLLSSVNYWITLFLIKQVFELIIFPHNTFESIELYILACIVSTAEPSILISWL